MHILRLPGAFHLPLFLFSEHIYTTARHKRWHLKKSFRCHMFFVFLFLKKEFVMSCIITCQILMWIWWAFCQEEVWQEIIRVGIRSLVSEWVRERESKEGRSCNNVVLNFHVHTFKCEREATSFSKKEKRWWLGDCEQRYESC